VCILAPPAAAEKSKNLTADNTDDTDCHGSKNRLMCVVLFAIIELAWELGLGAIYFTRSIFISTQHLIFLIHGNPHLSAVRFCF
jgi:hypothetical protein